MPRENPHSQPIACAGYRLSGMNEDGIARECSAPATSLCPDWDFLGYHGTLWSSIKRASARSSLPPRTPLRLLTVDKLKEWLPRHPLRVFRKQTCDVR
jgi:hypothetical protein